MKYLLWSTVWMCGVMMPGMLLSQTAQVQETSSHILVNFDAYQVQIDRANFGFEVLRSYQTVMKTSVPAVYWQEEGHSPIVLEAVENWSQRGNHLTLRVSAGANMATVTLKCHPDRVEWTYAPVLATHATIGLNLDLESAGSWFGGEVVHAHRWPLDQDTIRRELFSTNRNVTAPVWFTSRGAAILADTYQPLGYGFNQPMEGAFTLKAVGGKSLSHQLIVGADVVNSYRIFAGLVGLPERIPPKDYFSDPIFNTWIALFYDQHQAGILDYARKIREHDLPAKVFIIDDGWSAAHGNLEFDRQKFPDPKGMIDSLHHWGFKVLLWVTPLVVPQSDNFPWLAEQGYLMTTDDGKPGLAPWWHDPASPIDLSNPRAYHWLQSKYQRLVDEYGVDGFKLDTGDGRYRRDEFHTYSPITQTEYTDAFLALGADFEYNEYKVGWSAQQLGIVQRLRDKAPEWTGYEGMDLIVSHGMVLSLLGYPYWSPDMIGGGWNTPFQDPAWEGMDEELFIRWTQASTFMPMMQFSYGPWNLSQETVAICRRYMHLHQELGEYLYGLAMEAQQTGMPMTRPLFFADPTDSICFQQPNQFMLGERFMVAPVLAKGQTTLDVYLPSGTWKDFWSEKLYSGQNWLRAYEAPLEKLPIFIKIE